MRVTRFLMTICLLALATAHAAADPAAEQLFRDGRALLKARKVDEACDKFQQSRDVEVKFGTLLNLADCRERQGKFATAWELFLEARAIATRDSNAWGVGETTKRSKKIEGKRAFLTVAISAEHRVPGLVILRNGSEIAASTWDQPLAVDPGSYVIEAKAEGYEPATVTVQVAAKAKATATIPALVKLAVVEPPPQPPTPLVPTSGEPGTGPSPGDGVRKDFIAPPPAPRSEISPPLRRASLGVALGGTSDGELTPGLRAIAQSEIGPGAIRGVFTMQYARLWHDTSYSGDNSNLFAFGLGLDYLLAWHSGLGSAVGIGVGLDLFQGGITDDDTPPDPSLGVWKAVRVSPIIARLQSRRWELGLHAVVIVQDSPILIATAAVDWFIW